MEYILDSSKKCFGVFLQKVNIYKFTHFDIKNWDLNSLQIPRGTYFDLRKDTLRKR